MFWQKFFIDKNLRSIYEGQSVTKGTIKVSLNEKAKKAEQKSS
jgi:hypothetical protein